MKNQIVKLDKKLFLLQKHNIYKCFFDLLKQDNRKVNELLNRMEEFIDNESAIIYVSMANNSVVGFIWGYVIEERKIHINYFAVLNEYRGRKIGYNLLNTMMTMNKNYNFELLANVDNERAIKLYKKMGFKNAKIINKKIKMDFFL